jgi:putative transposase
MPVPDVAVGKRTAADPGAWLVFEDESGQGLKPPKGRTWGRRGQTPVVTVTGGSNKRVSLAALIAVKPGQRPQLIYRVHTRRRGEKRKGFTEKEYARLLDTAHAQLARPVVLVWDNLNAHVSGIARSLANLVKHNISELTALAKTRLRRMQYRPGLLAQPGSTSHPSLTPQN